LPPAPTSMVRKKTMVGWRVISSSFPDPSRKKRSGGWVGE
jgi:hypothetical protein